MESSATEFTSFVSFSCVSTAFCAFCFAADALFLVTGFPRPLVSLYFRHVKTDFPLWKSDYSILETDVSVPHNTLQAPKCVLTQSRRDG